MRRPASSRLFSLALLLASVLPGVAAAQGGPEQRNTSRGDKMIAEYFRRETAKLTRECLADIETKEDWLERRGEYRQQLFEMLGLDPLPERTPLKPEITGKIEHDDFTVEKLHFQSRPGLYVTGNLYVPKDLQGRAPTILYVCGHSRQVKDGVSFGNKAGYQHHGAWFARNGYVCLTIDTLQLGEIPGIHHGLHRENMWWWYSRGYISAGVEAWNCIRALDYLETRPEVDAERIGVTGRSGGGAYSWWIAALDDRIKVAVPVAGITSLQNHVVDDCIEGHCDCMYMVNTYGWDFAQLAALVAPRPLLIANTDKDRIFPLDGVVDVYFKTRRIYELLGAADHIGLNITEGPHKDTQELQVHAFVWFNRFLKNENPPIEMAAHKFFEPEQLRVFDQLPDDERNTTIQETFTPKAEPPQRPVSASEWESQRDGWLAALKEKSFRGWPEEPGDLDVAQAFTATHDDVTLSAWDFTSQANIRLRLYLAHRGGLKPSELDLIVLNVLDEQGWEEFLGGIRIGFEEHFRDEHLPEASKDGFEQLQKMFRSFEWGMAYVAPRGVGPTAWDQSEREQTHIRRRFMLLGQTRDGMQVWDARRAVQAVRSLEGVDDVPLWLQGERVMAGVALYASLFEPGIARLDLWDLPASHREGPTFLNVLRFLDMPQAVAMAAERSQVRVYGDESAWQYPKQVADALGWGEKQFQMRKPSAGERGRTKAAE